MYSPTLIFLPNGLIKYIADIFYGKNEENRYDKPYKRYVARYLFFIKWLGSLMQIPEIQLFTDRMKKKEVDLVIDVGNSATCALLFENKDDNSLILKVLRSLLFRIIPSLIRNMQSLFL